MRRGIGYVLAFAWAALACSIQLVIAGFMPAAETSGGGFVARALVPDLSGIVLVAAVARAGRGDVLFVALSVTLGRIGFTGSPPAAILAGTLMAALVADSLRSIAEVDLPSLRVVAASVGAFVYLTWLVLVDLVRGQEASIRGALEFGAVNAGTFSAPLMTAVATGLIAFALWPIFRSLAGLAYLERRAF